MAFAPEETAPSRSLSEPFADAVTLSPAPKPPHLQSEDEDDWTSEARLTNRPPPRTETPLPLPSEQQTVSLPESNEEPSAEQPATPESEKRRDSVPVVTSGEVDDMDIDAMLAAESAAPRSSEVINVSPGSGPPAASGESAVADAAPQGDVLATNEVARISDKEFEDARGRPASIHPEAGASAGVSHDDLVRADIIWRLKKAHVTLTESDDIPTTMLRHMATVIVDGHWVNDEAVLREVMLLALAKLDPATYGGRPQNVTEGPTAVLTLAFLHELRKKKVPSALKLEERKPREGIALPPLPSSPSSPQPVSAPPRPGKKR